MGYHSDIHQIVFFDECPVHHCKLIDSGAPYNPDIFIKHCHDTYYPVCDMVMPLHKIMKQQEDFIAKWQAFLKRIQELPYCRIRLLSVVGSAEIGDDTKRRLRQLFMGNTDIIETHRGDEIKERIDNVIRKCYRLYMSSDALERTVSSCLDEDSAVSDNIREYTKYFLGKDTSKGKDFMAEELLYMAMIERFRSDDCTVRKLIDACFEIENGDGFNGTEIDSEMYVKLILWYHLSNRGHIGDIPQIRTIYSSDCYRGDLQTGPEYSIERVVSGFRYNLDDMVYGIHPYRYCDAYTKCYILKEIINRHVERCIDFVMDKYRGCPEQIDRNHPPVIDHDIYGRYSYIAAVSDDGLLGLREIPENS